MSSVERKINYNVDEKVIYSSTDGYEEVTIAKVHLDDIEPYYTIIRHSCNREKQTDNCHLQKYNSWTIHSRILVMLYISWVLSIYVSEHT